MKTLAFVILTLYTTAAPAAPSQVLDTAGTACADYIRDTWSLNGDRLVIEDNRIYTCTDGCTDPRLRGVDVTEGLTAKFGLKKNRFEQILKSKCKAPPQSGKTWPGKCRPNGLDIFKVLIPFTGNPSEFCFCEDIAGSPEPALCRKVDGTDRMVAVFAEEPMKRTLDSACQVTSINGAGFACLCSQQNPTNRKNYVRCLRDKSSEPAGAPESEKVVPAIR